MVELALPAPAGMTGGHTARMYFDGRIPATGVLKGRTVRFRVSPRDAKVWRYVVRSDAPGLDGLAGELTAALPPVERTRQVAATHPNWWLDDPDPAAAEGIHAGARSVSRWREAYLRDFRVCSARRRPPAR